VTKIATIDRIEPQGDDVANTAPVPAATANAGPDRDGQRQLWSRPRLTRLDTAATAGSTSGVEDGDGSSLVSG
jgi:hypothetical protein